METPRAFLLSVSPDTILSLERIAMIIITRPDITDDELDHLRERIEAAGLHTHLSRGEHRTIIGCIGDETRLDRKSVV